jgi:hypothetical protein
MEADNATGNPSFVRTKGNVTKLKPLLMPLGSTRKRNAIGRDRRGLGMTLFLVHRILNPVIADPQDGTLSAL